MDTLFVDSETDGLYGTFLSVAAIVLDDDRRECDSFYVTLKDPEKYVSLDWIKENVLQFLGKSVRSCDEYYVTEADLIESFFSFYMTYHGCDVIADVPHPVESDYS